MLETLNNILILRLSFMQGCGNVVFFEARKKQDLYLWLAKTPEGPSVKFLALNGAQTSVHAFVPLTSLPLHVKKRAVSAICCAVHTMAELKLSGNHLKGSRPLLSFHAVRPHPCALELSVLPYTAIPFQATLTICTKDDLLRVHCKSLIVP